MKKFVALIAALVLSVAGFTFVADAAEAPADCSTPTLVETRTVNHPEVSHNVTVTVVDEPAVPATDGTHYSWNGGARGIDSPPTVVPPHEDWQVQGVGFDPHLQGGGDPATWFPVDPATSGLHVLGNSPVNASWFYYVPGTDEVPAVTHEETTKVVDSEAFTETIRTEVPNPDYPCDKDTPKTPDTPNEPVDNPETKVNSPAPVEKKQTVEVPTVINSGL